MLPDLSQIYLTYDAGMASRWMEMLSDEERLRMEAFPSDKRRREFLVGRVAARKLLSERLDVPAQEVPLTVAEDGAVEVVAPDLFVSITHSGDRAVAAVASRPVGADIEAIAVRHPELHRFMCHPEEYALLEELPLDRDRACILYWAIKEAVLKGLRTGLRMSPKKLRLDIDLPVREARVAVEGSSYWRARFEERDGFFVAVAVVD